MPKKNRSFTIIAVLSALLIAFSLNACKPGKPATYGDDETDHNTMPVKNSLRVGISMPASSARTEKAGAAILRALESSEHTVDLRYAKDIETQFNQIVELMASDCNLLIVSPVNEFVLSNALENARANNIPVIACDKMIYNTDAVDYFIAFDNALSGRLHGEYLVNRLISGSLSDALNIEILPGDLRSGDASFSNSLVESLDEYIRNESIRIPSYQTPIGKTQFSPDDVSVSESDFGDAKRRMEQLIADYDYRPGQTALSAVVCKNDAIAKGVIEALKAAGYTSGNFPLITGGNCDLTNVRYMLEGYQSMSLFLNPEELGKKAAALVEAISNNKKLGTNFSVEIDSREIPAYMCEPVVCTSQNYEAVLLDSGYYDSLY